MRQFSTPMMQQYQAIKQHYTDCLLFFRLGDFYELFLDDAIVGAKLLEITLTQRPSGKDGPIPMAGVPFHAADSYIAKLVKAGHKVAICEQVTEPDSRGIVDREVVRVITPGTILDEKTLEQKEHNYLMSVSLSQQTAGLAMVDLSTGDMHVTEIPYGSEGEATLEQEIARFKPAECIISPADYDNPDLRRRLTAHHRLVLYPLAAWPEYTNQAAKKVQAHFKLDASTKAGLEQCPQAYQAVAAVLGYLKQTQRQALVHMRRLQVYQPQDYLRLDPATIVNLELFSTIREREDRGSFVWMMDATVSAMGGRLLRQWIRQPLVVKERIQERLDGVEELWHTPSLRQNLRRHLQQLYDIERIIGRLSMAVGNGMDVINLKLSLRAAVAIKDQLAGAATPLLVKVAADIHSELRALAELIEQQIVDDPPVDIKSGHLIKAGVSAELDQLRQQTQSGKTWLTRLEQSERQKTGIGSLKVRFNKVFGYYIEISKPNLHLVPGHYMRKQSMVNAERFITTELKEYESTIVVAEERVKKLEYQLFCELVNQVLRRIDRIQQAALSLAELDCLVCFALVAEQEHYIKPELTDSGEIHVEDSRHPMVEKHMGAEQFVPNDVTLNTNDHQLLLLTGPNMAGKSVFMRQVAIIVLMTHVGMFVPAKVASVSLVDRIFVRSGASDAIGAGLSTFMVEMVETAEILRHATTKSLIIMDEIGRGTSTYDGISIAWAVAEYLVTEPRLQAKTLFATHFHELQGLEDQYPERLKNYHMTVIDKEGEPVFLYKLARGRAAHSYAIPVAQKAGLPLEVTRKAREVLRQLEERGALPDNAINQIPLSTQTDQAHGSY